ncbi:hypothetical protein [Amycolatopsis australiensis]|uniref:LPXTG-motif cell wall anchor domain-containing protein n=1 Tax=Amycolatopsis australiensis TaxID=546364 RepID=A0A1K1PFM3_9PSEU|nr:hypothetical protein [Amycolatopsis australiensis]SFW46576.1 hypothetical protein SAMN04489730_0591 [Amycolatopsis australiensis]
MLARGLTTLTAAAVLTSVFAVPARAEEEPASTAPSTSDAAGPPAGSTAPTSAVPSSSAAENKPAAQPQDEPPQRARVEVSASLDKDTYQTDEDVHFTFTVKNIGSTTAKGLLVSQDIGEPTDLVVPWDVGGWGPLRNDPGLDLEPGKSFVLHGTGKIREVDQTATVLRGVVFDATHFGVGQFSASAKVTPAPGHAEGLVYGDKNGNGKLDPGEELAGTKLTLRYVNGNRTLTATSGPGGKITFDVPGADYYLGGEVVDGWLFPWHTVRIGEHTELDVRGVPPLNGALKASMAFTQDSYRVGDTAHVTVTLSNSGSIPLTGIVAGCNRIGDGHILSGRGPGWGDLGADGVTIPAGETRTFDVAETVPEAALNRGIVVASCDFGYREVDIEHHAQADARAAVPGAKAVVEGNVGTFDNQGQVKDGLAGVKVVLVADQHCPVVAERTTDAKGHFEFLDVAPGPDFHLYFLPPAGWKVKYENPMWINVYGPPENHYPYRILAEEGDAPLPAVPVNPADCTATTPAPVSGAPGGTGGTGGTGGGQSSGSGLASTGVEALGLGALALTALFLGGVLVLGSRRRRREA